MSPKWPKLAPSAPLAANATALHFERAAAAYPPVEPVDPGDMADMVNAVIEGEMILARGIGYPQLLVRQVLRARQMLRRSTGAEAPLAVLQAARQKGP